MERGEVEVRRRYFGRYLWWRKMEGKKKDNLGKHVVVEEGRNKGKGKRKRNEMRRYFLGLQK